MKIKKIEEADCWWLPTLPSDEFIADPFLYKSGHKYGCLFEHYKYGGKGKIAEIKDVFSSNTAFNTIIMGAKHYSYPFVFEENNTTYCAPECYESNSLALLRKDQGRWLHFRDVLEKTSAIDPTILKYKSKYWIFCTLKNDHSNLNLHIYYSEMLEGPYTAHPLNPVKTDITSARPAGDFIKYNGDIFRPSQNCSRTYGGSIIINKLVSLDETKFQEEYYCELLPSQKYSDGLHTLSYKDEIYAIDGKKIYWHPFVWWYRIKNKINAEKK